MESVKWVCAEALQEHGCVSPLTVSLKEEEEEVLVDLDYQVDFPCVVQWSVCGLQLLRHQMLGWTIKNREWQSS